MRGVPAFLREARVNDARDRVLSDWFFSGPIASKILCEFPLFP